MRLLDAEVVVVEVVDADVAVLATRRERAAIRVPRERVDGPEVPADPADLLLVDLVEEILESNLPALEWVVVTAIASWPPPRMMWSRIGERMAAFTGRSAAYVLRHSRVSESKSFAVLSRDALMKCVLSWESERCWICFLWSFASCTIFPVSTSHRADDAVLAAREDGAVQRAPQRPVDPPLRPGHRNLDLVRLLLPVRRDVHDVKRGGAPMKGSDEITMCWSPWESATARTGCSNWWVK